MKKRYSLFAAILALLAFAGVLLVGYWTGITNIDNLEAFRLSLEISEQNLQEARERAEAAADAALRSEELRIQEREELSARIRELDAAVMAAESGRRRAEGQRRDLEAALAQEIDRLPQTTTAKLAESSQLLMLDVYPDLHPEIYRYDDTDTTVLNRDASIGMNSALLEVRSRRHQEGMFLQELEYAEQILVAQDNVMKSQRQEIEAEILRGDTWKAAWEARGHEIERHESRAKLQEALIEVQMQEIRKTKWKVVAGALVGVAVGIVVAR